MGAGSEHLDVGVAQPEIVPHDVAGNARRHGHAVRSAHARVVMFPELSLTGYEFGAEPIDPSDVRLAPLIEACADTGSLALVGAPVAAADPSVSSKCIGLLAVDGDGARIAYRKMWLGTAERRYFEPGELPTVLEVDGWRLGLAICRDTGVLAHAEATASLGIDAYLAGVLEHAENREEQPTRADRIARDHGVWVAVASYAGSAGEGFHEAAGGSGIWRPDRTTAARAGVQPGEVATARLTRS